MTPFLCNVRRSVILSEAVSKPRVAVVYRVLLVAQVVLVLLQLYLELDQFRYQLCSTTTYKSCNSIICSSNAVGVPFYHLPRTDPTTIVLYSNFHEKMWDSIKKIRQSKLTYEISSSQLSVSDLFWWLLHHVWHMYNASKNLYFFCFDNVPKNSDTSLVLLSNFDALLFWLKLIIHKVPKSHKNYT